MCQLEEGCALEVGFEADEVVGGGDHAEYLFVDDVGYA
ncbi:hypothetical protein EVA_18006 [gut metagenome]|uniref:Uncharacterized protein n=1 Tax=gut metagenome TaxID=749906 RepID=J9FHG2_9ZZZZ